MKFLSFVSTTPEGRREVHIVKDKDAEKETKKVVRNMHKGVKFSKTEERVIDPLDLWRVEGLPVPQFSYRKKKTPA
ncbi:hypothetical protein CPT_Mendera_230 [Stenotrophomonas phage Mendera]|uniref:Uncharacterized protein n=2 Tax=Menderavirus TaxID=2843421 RepID=A0A482IH25_9CAUD|nr:hypothetical protein HWC11_gp194 [Stenotrophomonas phage YB07]YP_009851264.1 hypothetical protein HWC60_gp185 [Stenotrophomonas phage Mendera]QBP06390.1 hypothetical protein [Stenotrophomonas phage YB07]QFR56756.1 hypothetical protein CPT_Mendera_230 [Stenotrophomonas phage Mendera]